MESEIFWVTSSISRSENQSYLDFWNSKGYNLYTVGKIKELSTTFIQTISTDSVVKLVKTGHN